MSTPDRASEPIAVRQLQATEQVACRVQNVLLTGPYEASTGDFASGTVLKERYVLEQVLGQGGMGQVYLGRDRVLDRAVAIKVIRPRDPELRNRSYYDANLKEAFSDEARIGANLTHPAIATVYDFGFHESEPFIVFEYIGGETLRSLLQKRGRLPLEDVRLIVGPLAQALDFAHVSHVVHRDLKPENIRATAQGHFKILDLGLARQFRDQRDWRFAGTPAYASPEQAAGQPCDGRTDQYALALVAYELLTGHRVFEHTDARELLNMHRNREPSSPRGLLPDLPESVSSALLRALHKDPGLRFGNCTEFVVALGCQVLSSPVPQSEVLRFTFAVIEMSGRWKASHSFRLRSGDMWIGLFLTADALWVLYLDEMKRLPLGAITDVRQGRVNWLYPTLKLCLRGVKKPIRQSFTFSLRKRSECKQWEEHLHKLICALPPGATETTEWPTIDPVVLMHRPPTMKYQTLGVVEFQAGKPQQAEVGLQVRAAMIGAHAVVNKQEERLAGFAQTAHRVSGMAIRAVDSDGHRELQSRWFADRVQRLTSRICGLIIVSLFFRLWCGLGRTRMVGSDEKGIYLAIVCAGLLSMHFWPFLLACVARWLLWPQLLRPLALAVLLLAFPLFLDLMVWALTLPFIWFLYRRTWQTYTSYRRWFADDDQRPPLIRHMMGTYAFATSACLFAILGGLSASAVGTELGNYLGRWLPDPREREQEKHSLKEQQARKNFDAGREKMQQNPQEAEAAFRRALPLFRELAHSALAQREDLHNLAAILHSLGLLHLNAEKIAEATESFQEAVASYEKLGASFPSYKNHKKDHERAQEILTVLLRDGPVWQNDAEAKEGRKLQGAGRHGAAAVLYREALNRHEKQKKQFQAQAVYMQLLSRKQNRLAWLLANCPDASVRDPNQAVELARKAVEFAPEEWTYWNTLGAAYYRAGNWAECLTALEKSMQLSKGGDVLDWLFFAMVYHKQGKTKDAQAWLNKSRESIARRNEDKFDTGPRFIGPDGRPDDDKTKEVRRLIWQSQRPEAERLFKEAEELIQSGDRKLP